MHKLFPSVPEGGAAAPAPKDTPAGRPEASHEPAASTRPFAWPPPEEDLEDWHVFRFNEPKPAPPQDTTPAATTVVPPAALAPASAPAQPAHSAQPTNVLRMPAKAPHVTARPPATHRTTAPAFLTIATPPEPDTEPAVRVAPPSPASARSWSWLMRAGVAALLLLAAGEAAYIATPYVRGRAVPRVATLVVQSQPTGAEVIVDGQPRGRTPFRAEFAPGLHVLELRKDHLLRRLPLALDPGAQATQYIELRASDTESAAAPAPARGASPAPTSPSASNQPPPAPVVKPTPTVGWLVVQSPVTLSILRNGELLGNSDEGRLKIGPGLHEVELSNTAAGYREATTVQIYAGQQTVLRPDLPQSTLDVTATPAARVLIDGREIGDTPLSQVALTIGSHDILLRHPDYGDRHVTTFIKVGTPARISVDFTAQQ